nr:hypothetical protein [Fodinicola feengrottensis]
MDGDAATGVVCQQCRGELGAAGVVGADEKYVGYGFGGGVAGVREGGESFGGEVFGDGEEMGAYGRRLLEQFVRLVQIPQHGGAAEDAVEAQREPVGDAVEHAVGVRER